MKGEEKTMKLKYERVKISAVVFLEEPVRTSSGEFDKDNNNDNMFKKPLSTLEAEKFD